MRLAYGSFTYACGVAGFTDPDRIVGYAIISGAFHPLNTAPHLRPLPSTGITPLLHGNTGHSATLSAWPGSKSFQLVRATPPIGLPVLQLS